MWLQVRSPFVAAAVLLATVAVLVGVDVVGDLASGASGWHVAVELAAVALAVGGAVALGWRARREVGELRRDLSATREEAERWRRDAEELLRGLGEAIDEQFARWELSPAEREVGLMLLKGLSLREIAEARGTSERTARQQARAIYAKAGLANRSELAAFFLEDLLLPPRAATADARGAPAAGCVKRQMPLRRPSHGPKRGRA